MRFNRRGNYTQIFGISSLVILGFGAIGIDWFRVRAADNQAQIAADSAAMAALIRYRYSGSTAQGEAAANVILDSNMIAEQMGGMEVSYVWGNWDWSKPSIEAWEPGGTPTNGVRALVGRTQTASNGEVDLWIAPAFGYNSTEVWGNSVAAMRSREIMLVMDITGSFINEWPDAKAASLAFLEQIYDSAMPGDRIGMVVFVGGAEVYTPLQTLATNYTAIETQWNDTSTCHEWDEMWTNFYGIEYPWLDWGLFQSLLGNDAPQMPPCYLGNDQDPLNYTTSDTWPSGAFPYYKESGTNQGAGIAKATEELINNGDDFATKIIVLVSDGLPQCVGETPACDSLRADAGVLAAAAAGDADISIFSVSFNDPFVAAQSEYMDSMVRGFGEFYETPDSAELDEILVEIANKIPTAVVR
jgi:hypothetical protein